MTHFQFVRSTRQNIPVRQGRIPLLLVGILLLAACTTAASPTPIPATIAATQPPTDPPATVATDPPPTPTPVPATLVVPTATDAPPPTAGTTPPQTSSTMLWVNLNSTDGTLPVPGESQQQTASLLMDIDGDGIDDLVVGARQRAPSMVWFRRVEDSWERYIIDYEQLNIEAGGTYHDIDADGDLDIVMGGDAQSNQVWWWENPAPSLEPTTPWTRRLIKSNGERMHHDQTFGDFDGDGDAELAFWNQRARNMMMAEIPADPHNAIQWSYTSIFTGFGEGIFAADIDGNGITDLLAAGRWFKYSGGLYLPIIIDETLAEARMVAGDLIPGGPLEVVMAPGETTGRAYLYTCDGDPAEQACWQRRDLLGFDVDHAHSLRIVDINDDGTQDIFIAEMRLNGDNADAGMWFLLNDGAGNFTLESVATGYGNHESRIADLDGDGDLDIFGKPYNWEAPRIDVWLQVDEDEIATDAPAATTAATTLPTDPPPTEDVPTQDPTAVPATEVPTAAPTTPTEDDLLTLDSWQRHVIDAARPWRAVFIEGGDLNGDNLPDIITGGWWYQNPGVSGGHWIRHVIGAPLDNMATVYDFDGDGDLDILGTPGRVESERFVWAENDGSGSFTIHQNIEAGSGDFLQGIVVGNFEGNGLEVMLSWHVADQGVQRLTVPNDPVSSTWRWDRIATTSQDEALSAGDLDRDGDLDLLLGTIWLRNNNGVWPPYLLGELNGLPPDRNAVTDINNDGLLDAVIGYEAINEIGPISWFEQGSPVTDMWIEHIIAEIYGPMSLDVADMDNDGDMDVIVGEHNLRDPDSARLFVFENNDGTGLLWIPHILSTGDEHHVGAITIDIDNDGDLDLLSIGWGHPQVLLYENLAK